jgi:DNA-binding LacI/PurR family transcriptional regulator
MNADFSDRSHVPDAIFVASDHMAMAVISALERKGIKVPQDVSIVGYDDAEASAYTLPALTTVQQNLPLVARRAMAVLIHQIHHEKVSMVTPMEPQFIIRDSVRERSSE